MISENTTCKVCGMLESAHPGNFIDGVCNSFTADWVPRIHFPTRDMRREATGGRAGFEAYDPTRDSIWVEMPDADWTVAYRLMVQDGHLIVAEMRIYPTDLPSLDNYVHSKGPGCWSEEAISAAGGISGRLLREIRVGAHLKVAEEVFNGIRQRMGDKEYEEFFGPTGIPAQATHRVGRPRRSRKEDPQDLQARLAAKYVEKVRAGSRKPNVEIAEEEYLSRDAVRDKLHDARRNGYLTDPPHEGVAGGRLTPKGVERLRRAGYPLPATEQGKD